MYRDHFEKSKPFLHLSPQKVSCAMVLLTDELSLSNVILKVFNLHFKDTIENQDINKAKLFYQSSNDSAKMAVYLSSSQESWLGNLPKNELCM